MAGNVILATETVPFDPSLAKYASMLANLQGNILTSHGRDFTMQIFFTFRGGVAAAKGMVAQLRASGFILSAAEQAAQSPNRQEVFGTLLLSASGLAFLGLPIPAGFGDSNHLPGPSVDLRFAQSMKAGADELGDVVDLWDPPYHGRIDGMLIVAFGNHVTTNEQAVVNELFAQAKAARTIIETAADVLVSETGHSHVIDGEPREQFGFVDGISQPLYRTSDLPKSAPANFDPGAGLVDLLVPDPFTTAPDAFASFFVFRKLEQNVRGFNAAVARLADGLGVSAPLAGGMVVGRFKNGDSVALAAAASGPVPASPPPNDFNYGIDPEGGKCPFQAHIRKTNPRGDTARQLDQTGPAGAGIDAVERRRRIARRGITYGSRAHDLSDEPSVGVGLLFMCYQANIPDQFAFMQKNWVNANGFAPRPLEVGQDTVIGQGNHVDAQVWPTEWGSDVARALPDFGQFVTNRGGEFFLAVSIPTIEALGRP